MLAARYIFYLLAVLAASSLAGCAWSTDGSRAQASAPVAADNTAGAVPTPTFVPVQAQPPRFESVSPPPSNAAPPSGDTTEPSAAPPSDIAVTAPAEPTTVPVPQLQPTSVLVPPFEPTAPAVVAGAQSVRLDDTAWYGGWKQSKTYGGRSATWIYGTGTEYNAMSASFELVGRPGGDAVLSIEGMDGEHPPKMQISILVNGIEIYNGPNLLPDDNFDLATGTWDTYNWTIPATVLQPGVNTITIVGLSAGSFGQPPFMMLDYADIYISG